MIFDRKGKKILFGHTDEDNNEDSDYLPDEEDDSTGDAEKYEVEITHDKDNYGMIDKKEKMRHRWWAVKTVKLQKHLRGVRGEGGSKGVFGCK